MTDSLTARALAAALEPFAGQVYFAPECHREYASLGFDGSSAEIGGVQMPDGVAYFTSRGSVMGQVPGEVVAAAFGVFNPAAVVPAVDIGWTKTDAETICAARTHGAVDHLVRVVGARPDGIDRAGELLERATADLEPAGKPLFAGLQSLDLPGTPVGDAWRRADMLREYRGDAHVAAWTSAGFDACEIGLLSELYWGLPIRSYSRSRAWSDAQFDAAEARLEDRGLVVGGALTDQGRQEREAIEVATDASCRPFLVALGDDVGELTAMLATWSVRIRDEHGYPSSGPHELAEAFRRG